ncbi:MAG: class I SAM-dependent methyltransferase [Candidatus Sericytochromatia bacterium]
MNENIISPSIESIRLFESHIFELMLYTRRPETEIINLISNSMTERNKEWEKYSEYSIIDFHRLNESNIYCLSKWNCEEKYQSIIRYINYIAKIKKGDILDFGGGIGELSINLASGKNKVDFLEVPSKTLEYAKWRFRKRFLDIDIYTSLNQVKKEYDIIICLDVFEVLEKPLSHLKKFYSLLKDDGLLIFNMGKVGIKEHPMNLKNNQGFFDNIEKYCQDIGFIDTNYKNEFNIKVKQKSFVN